MKTKKEEQIKDNLEELGYIIGRLYADMETELIFNIINLLKDSKETNITSQWLTQKLSLANKDKLTNENIKVIEKYSKEIKEQVNNLINSTQDYAENIDNEVIEQAQKQEIVSEQKENKTLYMGLGLLAINNILKDFNNSNLVMLESANNNYRHIINDIKFKVDLELNIRLLPDELLNEKSKKVQDNLIKELKNEKGINFILDNSNIKPVITTNSKVYKEILADEVLNLNEKGLTGFVAKNGAEWSPEAYAKMKANAEHRQLTNQIQEERMKQIGGNYWEISQHIGARPLCYEDQGQIFSVNGDTTPIKDANGNIIKVRAWANSSFGKPDGILGINCRHNRYIFMPKLSVHNARPINKAENDKSYQEQQKQRYYERQIRNKKRGIEELKRIGATNEKIALQERNLREYSKIYNDYLKSVGRTRIYKNEQLLNKDYISSKQKKKITEQYNKELNKKKPT